MGWIQQDGSSPVSRVSVCNLPSATAVEEYFGLDNKVTSPKVEAVAVMATNGRRRMPMEMTVRSMVPAKYFCKEMDEINGVEASQEQMHEGRRAKSK